MGATRKCEENQQMIRKGDLVRATSKSFQKYHKGCGLVIDVVDIDDSVCYEIYWTKTRRRMLWTAGSEYLKKVEDAPNF